MTLLEKAQHREKPRRPRTRPDKQEVELSLAWARGDISYIQVASALGLTGSAAYSRIAIALREFIQNKDL